MKKSTGLLIILCIASTAWAEDPAATPATTASSTPAAVVSPTTVTPSTTTPSVALTGETIGAPAPTAMTQHPGDGVFVTLTRTAISNDDLPSNTQILTQDDIRAHGAQTAGDVLSYATGLAVPSQGGVGSVQLASIRGSSSNQVLVLVDGRPIGGSALSGSQDLSAIPVEQIDHIEILRGGATAIYGPNAIGGVINIISKRSTYDGLPISHLSFESGSFDRNVARADIGSRVGPLDFFLYGDQQQESGFRDNSDARTGNVGGNAGLSMGAAGKLLFDMSAYHGVTGVPGQFFPDLSPTQFNNSVEKEAVTPFARQDTATDALRTSYILPLPMNSLMTLRGFGSQRDIAYTNPDEFFPSNAVDKESTKGTDAQVALPLGFLVGGNFIHDRLDNQDNITPSNNFVASVDNWGLFAQEEIHWKTVMLTPSGRFDHNSQFGQTANPRVLLQEDATDWLRFSGDAARSYRAPTLYDLYTPFENFGGGFSYQGNPNLLPETAWTYDAGFELHEDSISFKATYFRSNISNLIQTTSDSNATTVNIGTARRQGGEVDVEHVMNQYFREKCGYTYLENEGIPLGYDHFVTLRLSPRHTVNYTATINPIKTVTFDNIFQYVSHQFEGNDDGNDPNGNPTEIGSHFLWNTRLSYAWRQLDMYVGVDDLTDKRYEERAGFPLPGRTYYGGVRLRLWG